LASRWKLGSTVKCFRIRSGRRF